MSTMEPHASAADGRERAASSNDVAEALRNGPNGALVVSAIAVALLFIGWLAFYFLLFMPRGPIG